MSIYALDNQATGHKTFAVFVGRGLEGSVDLSVLKPYLADHLSVQCHYRIARAVMGAADELQIMRGRHLLQARCSREAVGSLILADALGDTMEANPKPALGQAYRLLPNLGWVGKAPDQLYACLDARARGNHRMAGLVWNQTDSSIQALVDSPEQNHHNPAEDFGQGALCLWIDPPNPHQVAHDPHAPPHPLAAQPVSRARWLAEWMGRLGPESHHLISVEEMEAVSRLATRWGLVWGESIEAIDDLLANDLLSSGVQNRS